MPCSDDKARVAALVLHHLSVHGVVSARFLRTPNARSNLQRCKLFARGLQPGPQETRLQSRLRMREAYRAIPAYMARGFAHGAALAIIFGKVNAVHGNRLSGGATHLYRLMQTCGVCVSMQRPESWKATGMRCAQPSCILHVYGLQAAHVL